MKQIDAEKLLKIFKDKPFLIQVDINAGLETIGFLYNNFCDNALIEAKFVHDKLMAKTYNSHKGLWEYALEIQPSTVNGYCAICKIQELIQESKFDSNGWNWNLYEAPQSYLGERIKSFDILLEKESKHHYRLFEKIPSVHISGDAIKNDDQIKIYDLDDPRIVAWGHSPRVPYDKFKG